MHIAGTGHRPKYCQCKYNNKHPWLLNLKADLRTRLVEIADNHYEFSNLQLVVRAGGAIGWDTWLAQVALELCIPLHLYLPFPGQELQWPSDSRKEYERIKSLATNVVYTSQTYYSEVFLKRDLDMITGCGKILALLNPEVSSGGTFYTVGKAKELGINVENFWR